MIIVSEMNEIDSNNENIVNRYQRKFLDIDLGCVFYFQIDPCLKMEIMVEANSESGNP